MHKHDIATLEPHVQKGRTLVSHVNCLELWFSEETTQLNRNELASRQPQIQSADIEASRRSFLCVFCAKSAPTHAVQ